MPAPHALYSKMLAERTASRNVLVLFYLFYYRVLLTLSSRKRASSIPPLHRIDVQSIQGQGTPACVPCPSG
jgi:hypothetical protein